MDSGYRKEPIVAVCRLHPESNNFRKLVGQVAEDFEYWRDCKGDGNCFYRAVAAALLDYYLNQETEVFRGFYSNLYHQQFPIQAETDLRCYKIVLKVFYSLLKFKENQPGYLPFLLEKLLNSDHFMLPFIELLRCLAADGAKIALQDTGMLEDVSGIRSMGRAASEEDIKGLAYALGCAIVQVAIGTADYEAQQILIEGERKDDFKLHLLLADRHYSTLLPKTRVRTLLRVEGLKRKERT